MYGESSSSDFSSSDEDDLEVLLLEMALASRLKLGLDITWKIRISESDCVNIYRHVTPRFKSVVVARLLHSF